MPVTASENMTLDKFVGIAVKAHRNKGTETAAEGTVMRDIIQQGSKAAKPGQRSLKDAGVCVAVLCTVVFLPFHSLFVCM